MRSMIVVSAFVMLASGCTAYLKAEHRSRPPRREAADIALGSAAQLVVGTLIAVESYYWYQHASEQPDPADQRVTPSHGAVLGLLLGTGLVLGGVADETIALTQAMTDDYVLYPSRNTTSSH
jgi:hypothetical protein